MGPGTWRVTVIFSCCSYPTGLPALSALSNTTDTEALVTPACPCLYTSSCRLFTLTCAAAPAASSPPAHHRGTARMYHAGPSTVRPPAAAALLSDPTLPSAGHPARVLPPEGSTPLLLMVAAGAAGAAPPKGAHGPPRQLPDGRLPQLHRCWTGCGHTRSQADSCCCLTATHPQACCAGAKAATRFPARRLTHWVELQMQAKAEMVEPPGFGVHGCGSLGQKFQAGATGKPTWARLVIPSTKHIESRMLDFPVPFSPVMALKHGSKSETSVRRA